VCAAAQWLGIEFDVQANANNAICISAPTSEVSVLVLPTNEEWMIARHTADLIQ
jgi:acetate kinase